MSHKILTTLAAASFATAAIAQDQNDSFFMLGELPDTIFEALKSCKAGCIDSYCKGPKPVVLSDLSVMIFEPDVYTDKLCTEIAIEAIQAHEILSGALGELGEPAPRPQPTQPPSGTGPVTQRGGGIFWAARYLACSFGCQSRFGLSLINPD